MSEISATGLNVHRIYSEETLLKDRAFYISLSRCFIHLGNRPNRVLYSPLVVLVSTISGVESDSGSKSIFVADRRCKNPEVKNSFGRSLTRATVNGGGLRLRMMSSASSLESSVGAWLVSLL